MENSRNFHKMAECCSNSLLRRLSTPAQLRCDSYIDSSKRNKKNYKFRKHVDLSEIFYNYSLFLSKNCKWYFLALTRHIYFYESLIVGLTAF